MTGRKYNTMHDQGQSTRMIRHLILSLFLLMSCDRMLAQPFLTYMPMDTARQVILHAEQPEDRFYGYYGADRHYSNSGMFDSSEICEKAMYTIATSLDRDSLLCDASVSISNKYIIKQDYNYGLIYVLRALEYAKDDKRKYRVTLNVAGVYAWSGNFGIALDYLKKLDLIPSPLPEYALFRNMYYGMTYNGLGQPDSALVYLHQVEAGYNFRPDINGYVQALGEYAKAYELKGDTDLADVYYRKALNFSKEKGAIPFYLVIGNKYGQYLLAQEKYTEAGKIAEENIAIAKQIGNYHGVALAAAILQKVYNHQHNKDLAYQYALLQIAYTDSITNQKRITEFQNLTFDQKLKDIDEQTQLEQEKMLRKQNIQFALLAFGIITFIIVFLLLSRRFISNTKIIHFLGVVALLMVFEFINLVLHPFLDRVTNHSPLLMLMGLVGIASLLVPMHHRIEKWATNTLVEKNKRLRLAAAKKTIEKLSDSSFPTSTDEADPYSEQNKRDK